MWMAHSYLNSVSQTYSLFPLMSALRSPLPDLHYHPPSRPDQNLGGHGWLLPLLSPKSNQLLDGLPLLLSIHIPFLSTLQAPPCQAVMISAPSVEEPRAISSSPFYPSNSAGKSYLMMPFPRSLLPQKEHRIFSLYFRLRMLGPLILPPVLFVTMLCVPARPGITLACGSSLINFPRAIQCTYCVDCSLSTIPRM